MRRGTRIIWNTNNQYQRAPRLMETRPCQWLLLSIALCVSALSFNFIDRRRPLAIDRRYIADVSSNIWSRNVWRGGRRRGRNVDSEMDGLTRKELTNVKDVPLELRCSWDLAVFGSVIWLKLCIRLPCTVYNVILDTWDEPLKVSLENWMEV